VKLITQLLEHEDSDAVEAYESHISDLITFTSALEYCRSVIDLTSKDKPTSAVKKEGEEGGESAASKHWLRIHQLCNDIASLEVRTLRIEKKKEIIKLFILNHVDIFFCSFFKFCDC
jgi:hypothetical protein